ncbi:MAG TPA: aminotransferase class I/II-fold pyridoxal phosphate-dependent enzyme [Firmicutes bacterium]|nr:aminotransferase class I/II-fold pyridoxal phosphate-dependent enzyme [Bacillota bacterium]
MAPLASAIFAELAERKRELVSAGRSVYDFSIGSPDQPPALHIRQALAEAALDPANYQYAVKDEPLLLEAAAAWYRRRFGVELDPVGEIISLLGSQDGLAHLALALINPGDTVLVPDPGYPVFSEGPLLAQARLVRLPLLPENDYLVDFAAVDPAEARRAKLMIVSYPNNPTTALAPPTFYRDLIAFAKEYDILVLHDNAYCELTFDGRHTDSFLSYPGAREVGIEFNSLSKTYNLAGARIGFAFGNRDMIAALSSLKAHVDYGMFIPIQRAACAALNGPQDQVAETRATYERRRDFLVEGLAALGWKVPKPPATMFVWAPIPERFSSSTEFALELMEKSGVIVVPGAAFGSAGDRHVRLALVQPEKVIRAALASLQASRLFA